MESAPTNPTLIHVLVKYTHWMLVASWVKTGLVFNSIPWFEWDVWFSWERSSTLQTSVTQIFNVVCCGDRGGVGLQTGRRHRVRGYWLGVELVHILPIEPDATTKCFVSVLAVTQHTWLQSTCNVPSAKEVLHGLFVLNEIEMAIGGRELPHGWF